MLTIRFFARLREEAGQSERRLELPEGVHTVAQLRASLQARDPRLAAALGEQRNIRAAVNQRMCGADAPVHDGDEVAFFPPVTGG